MFGEGWVGCRWDFNERSEVKIGRHKTLKIFNFPIIKNGWDEE
jgi:hypothetical protein